MTTEMSVFSQITVAYQTLIAHYVLLLRITASGTVFSSTRSLIEDHIRTKLRDIAGAFTLCQVYLAGEITAEDQTWLDEQIDYVTKLAEPLPDIKNQILSLAWKGLTLLFGSALLQFAGPDNKTDNFTLVLNNFMGIIQLLLAVFGGTLFIVSILAFGAGTLLTNDKRTYFQPGVNEYGILDNSRLNPYFEVGVNIYELENRLYRLLGRKKPPEVALDVWGLLAFFVVGVWGLTWLAYTLISGEPPVGYPKWSMYFGVLPLVVWVFVFIPLIRTLLQRDK